MAPGDVVISAQGYDELAQDRVAVANVVSGAEQAVAVEAYPGYHKGPCVLVPLHDAAARPLHIPWGIPRDGIPHRVRGERGGATGVLARNLGPTASAWWRLGMPPTFSGDNQ